MNEITLESQLFEVIQNKELSEEIKLAKVDMLVKLGVDVNVVNKNNTPLMSACIFGSEKIVKLLIDNGADVHQKDDIGRDALMIASWLGDNNEKVLELLIDNGADVNQKDIDGYSALMWASVYGYKEIVEFLVLRGADVNQKSNNGNTVLMWASNYGYKEIVELLIQSGADIGAKNNDGEKAIDLAKDDETRDVIKKACKNRFFAKVKRGFGMGE